MKHFIFPSFFWGILLASLAAISLFSCSTLPPAQPARDVKSIVGKWEGYAKSAKYDRFSIKLVVKENGTWQMAFDPSYATLGRIFSGKARVEDNKFIFNTDTPGLRGACTLHFWGDTRLLIFGSDDGDMQAEFKLIY
jgi:hypothetical protein